MPTNDKTPPIPTPAFDLSDPVVRAARLHSLLSHAYIGTRADDFREADSILDEQEKLLRLQIAMTPATTMQGAMAQVVHAIYCLREVTEIDGKHINPLDAQEAARHLWSMLFSVLDVLERETGISPQTVGANRMLTAGENPHRVFAAILAQHAPEIGATA